MYVASIFSIRVPVIWARVIFYSQFLVCKFLFFADKEGKFISITNRYVYMHEHTMIIHGIVTIKNFKIGLLKLLSTPNLNNIMQKSVQLVFFHTLLLQWACWICGSRLQNCHVSIIQLDSSL